MFNDELKNLAVDLVMLDNKCEVKISQAVYILEEMSELSKEILKQERFKGSIDNIKEEMADVLCTILTYAVDNNIDVEDLEKYMVQKFKRGIARIKVGEQ